MTQLLSSGLEIFSQQLLDLDRRQSDLNKGLRATVSNWAYLPPSAIGQVVVQEDYLLCC